MKKYLLLTCVTNATPEPVVDETSDVITTALETEPNTETTAPDTTVVEPEVTEAEFTENSESEVTESDTIEAVTEPAEESPFDEEWIVQNTVIPDVIPEFEQGDMVILSNEDFFTHGIYFHDDPLYRSTYYNTSIVSRVLDENENKEFREKFLIPEWDAEIQPNEMYLVTAIKYFKISREDCERGVAEWANYVKEMSDKHGWDINNERYEIPNLDIIYTFDNEIINNYYLREQ